MTFKKLVYLIAEGKTNEDMMECMGEVTMSFQKEKITWKDHEVLMSLISAKLSW